MRQATQMDIYRKWVGDVIIGCLYRSPIPGRRDSTPSFNLYIKNDEIRWNDHGLSMQYGYHAVNLVQHIEGFPLTPAGYHQTVRYIQKVFKTDPIVHQPLVKLRQRPARDQAPYIDRRDFEDFELAFWKDRFDISEFDLEWEGFGGMNSMSWFGENGRPNVISTPEDPAFVYWWSLNPAKWKLYRPLTNKRDRFRQENCDGIIEGWSSFKMEHQFIGQEKFDILFILSSSKDRVVVKKCFYDLSPLKTSGLNPKGEADFMPLVEHREEIESMAHRIIVLYDGDDPGFKATIRVLWEMNKDSLWSGFDMRGLLHGQKDFSDFIDTTRGGHTYNELYNIIKNIIS